MSADEAVARVREFLRLAKGVLVIKALVPRGGPQKLHLADLEAVVEQSDEMRELLDALVSDESCWLDHHGYCQGHSRFDDGECPHARAKRLLGQEVNVRD
jgi:hypothetical protein